MIRRPGICTRLSPGGSCPRTRAFARRLEGGHSRDRSRDRVEELNARVSELEAQVTRIQELEERLDFTERMLARQQSPRLTPGQLEEEL